MCRWILIPTLALLSAGHAYPTVALPAADLAVSQAAAPSPVPSGSNLTYTITVRNNGPSNATTVVVTDTVPNQTTFVSCSATDGGVCQGSGAAQSVQFASLASGASATITLVVMVKSSVGDAKQIKNKARVKSTSIKDSIFSNNTSIVTVTTTKGADLSLTMSVAPDPAPAGGTVTYTILLTNGGPATARPVTLTDDLPSSLSFVSCSATKNGVCGGSGNNRTVSFTQLGSGLVSTIKLVTTLGLASAPGTAVSDSASATAGSPSDPNAGNNRAEATFTVASGADLALTAFGAPDPVADGGQVTYTFEIFNAGPQDAASVAFSAELPASTSFQSCAATAGGTCGGSGGSRTANWSSLSSGTSATVTLVATVDAGVPAGTTLTAQGSVSAVAPGDPSASNNAASAAVTTADSVAPRRDVVLIVTDDQAPHTLSYMPLTNAALADSGIVFTNAFVATPICCPSRATILTGLYSHNHGVLTNLAPLGGATRFNDSSTLATWLQAAGYRTGIFGKYMNEYVDLQPWPYVAPGWTDWEATVGGGYFGFTVVDNGTEVAYRGQKAENYSVNVMARRAVSFIENAPPGQPIFVYYTPFAPHEPAITSPEDTGRFADQPGLRQPDFNEADVSDKPQWVQDTPPLTVEDIDSVDTLYRRQLESLQAVDRAVLSLVDALARTGRLANAVIVFTSDNGWSQGEHRRVGKACVYEECVRVPLLVRAPGVPHRTDDHLMTNVDLAATIAEWAGISPPSMNGQSFAGLVQDPTRPWRTDILLEYLGAGQVDERFHAVRTAQFVYAEYDNGDRELYDLAGDPFEMQNVVNDPGYASTRSQLQVRLAELEAE